MFKFLVLFTFVASTLGAAVPSGLLPQLDGRIVGGAPTTISAFPWQVSLQRSGAHSCGGSVYSNTIVVTAAHCLQSVSKATLKVRAGSSYWNSGGVLIPVEDFKNHQKYNPNNMMNDIAIVRLSLPLTYGVTIKSIKLATTEPASGAPAIVTGWGRKLAGGGSSPVQLQKVELSMLGRTECGSSDYNYGRLIRPTMICALAPGNDACQGDSGGPLVSGGVLVGVVSWGEGCAFENYPGVYANVADLADWVEETAKSMDS